ncbi:MAG: thiamine diphosphokinase [Holosporaceae bacterium]|jgi:thiamine pyrophosphokinase|nr:thiamine diphosphokinase [Holosporaceae bacterium]
MISILKSLSKYKSILCLDGDLPCDFIKKIDFPIIAADGAANTLIKNSIEPSLIIGDLDSVDDSLLTERAHLKIENQESTDFEKALDFIRTKSLTPTIVMGIDGGYVDHILGNISIFSRTEYVAISNDMIFMSLDKSQNFDVPMNTKISIFGMPRCSVKSKGLKWELDGELLSFPGESSQSNRAIYPTVELEILYGRAMVFIYTKVIHDAGAL